MPIEYASQPRGRLGRGHLDPAWRRQVERRPPRLRCRAHRGAERRPEVATADAVALHDLAHVLRRDPGVLGDEDDPALVASELGEKVEALEARQGALAGEPEREVEVFGGRPLGGQTRPEDEVRDLAGHTPWRMLTAIGAGRRRTGLAVRTACRFLWEEEDQGRQTDGWMRRRRPISA